MRANPTTKRIGLMKGLNPYSPYDAFICSAFTTSSLDVALFMTTTLWHFEDRCFGNVRRDGYADRSRWP
jgi:hypothetical protein